jgi:hypothetical protein
MEHEIIWTDGIELALNDIKDKSFNNSEHHKENYYYFKGYLKYFRVPTIILSGMNSVFSVGLQPYISQSTISVLCCSISLVCGIIASLELFVGIQNMMEKELISSKEFYILSSDILKTLSVEREHRILNGKIYLDNIHTKFCNLIEMSNILYYKKNNLQMIKPLDTGVMKKIMDIPMEEIKIPIEEIKIPMEEIKEQLEETKIHIEEKVDPYTPFITIDV